jgi:hypothetical protein
LGRGGRIEVVGQGENIVNPVFMPRWFDWVVAALCTAFALVQPVRAGEVARSDAKAVRQVIEAQLAAFAEDDAEKAFSFAAPSIRESFGTAEKFMAMVRRGYPVVYRPTSVRFLDPVLHGDTLMQRVRMTDDLGAAWMVVYSLERQDDRSWRITACIAARGDGRMT